MQLLPWISDEFLINAVEKLLIIADKSLQKSETDFNKNVLDPFSAIFQIAGFNISHDEWLIAEKTRQAQKSLQNHVGDFHQIILGGVGSWENLETGQIMDLVNHDKKIIAEIKNKYNTVKGSDLSGLYQAMENLVSNKYSTFKGYTAYYVTIIPKKPTRINTFFNPSDKEKGTKFSENHDIRLIDGASFYEIVTGDPNALFNLYQTLPTVIQKLTGKEFKSDTINQMIKYFELAYGSSHSKG
ncbi:Eco47II restriction endonuclease [Aquiflexum balticum DSM 16537]|uniref:Eco47II restriction endonuclease n=1 Tax=Aquiflexum balticum DSM 16537 TaxID=758820 RepID=A0A1W2H0Q9_9BACT|nr:Eco47II family restriction endonuclease [Aquiflexum balticum]SMD42461.1 Eco47II restriction endonuclease [Aquiflexum balticum DSM 16537]